MGNDVQREIEELLPFYLNGSLSGDEHARVEAALKADEGLRQQLEFLSAISGAVQSDGPASAAPGDLGLARLRREIGRQQPRRSALRSVSALAAAFILGVGVMALWPSLDRGPEDAIYEQAGGPVAKGALIVAFRPGATAEQISTLLLSVDGVIVDGPSAIGLYRVDLPEGADAGTVAGRLLAAGEIVESAQKAE
jgi:hypothetical protein